MKQSIRYLILGSAVILLVCYFYSYLNRSPASCAAPAVPVVFVSELGDTTFENGTEDRARLLSEVYPSAVRALRSECDGIRREALDAMKDHSRERLVKAFDVALGFCGFHHHTNPYNVAVCMVGSSRVSNVTVTTFIDKVYNHLGKPDVFSYMSRQEDIPEEWKHFNELWPKISKRYVFGPDYDYASAKNYSECLDWPYSEKVIWHGGWPRSKNPHMHNMHQYYGADRCGVMIREEERRRAKQYDWIIFSRPDHSHFAPHPSMGFLPRDRIYIPSGSDWGGLNDRHTIFPRAFAEVRFNFHQGLMDGSYHCPFRGFDDWMNMEKTFKDLYERNGMPVQRYPATSLLASTQPACPPGQETKYPDEQSRRDRNLKDPYISERWKQDEVEKRYWNRYRECVCSMNDSQL